jgi:hypothetical protein
VFSKISPVTQEAETEVNKAVPNGAEVPLRVAIGSFKSKVPSITIKKYPSAII